MGKVEKNEKPEKVKINMKDCINDDTMDLSLCQLTEVPSKEIASYKRITILDLSSNKIISLGKHFLLLKNLTKLDLSKNQLKYLPEDFGNLTKLRHLDLYNNRLEHLPLSFGDLHNLRYLDLKGNPLMPALAKVVGQCLTTKDCHNSAINTVKFLLEMQHEMHLAREQLRKERSAAIEPVNDSKTTDIQKPKTTKKNKNKSKKNNSNNSPNSTSNAKSVEKPPPIVTPKSVKKSSTALRTVLVFFFLLAINIVMIYIVTVKNPIIAEKILEFIPIGYRDIISSQTEHFRLRVSDWIEQFRTAPEQN